MLAAAPVVVPSLGFAFYDVAARVTRTTLDLLANRNWESVDGNAYEIAVLEPTLTGIVLPAVSITLGARRRARGEQHRVVGRERKGHVVHERH